MTQSREHKRLQWNRWRRNNLEKARRMSRESTKRWYYRNCDELNKKARESGYHQEYYHVNRQKLAVRQRMYWKKRKQRVEDKKRFVFSHYSPKVICQKCGFSDIRALSIDHVNGGGGKQGLYGYFLYCWLEKNNFPTCFQVLCMNCQRIKQFENGEWAKPRL